MVEMFVFVVAKAVSMLEEEDERLSELLLRAPRAASTLDDEFERLRLEV